MAYLRFNLSNSNSAITRCMKQIDLIFLAKKSLTWRFCPFKIRFLLFFVMYIIQLHKWGWVWLIHKKCFLKIVEWIKKNHLHLSSLRSKGMHNILLELTYYTMPTSFQIGCTSIRLEFLCSGLFWLTIAVIAFQMWCYTLDYSFG